MAPPDKQYANGLVGPLAVRVEKVGLGVLASVIIAVVFVLLVLQPEHPTFLYIWLPGNVGLFAMSAVRLRRMPRQDEQD